MLFDNRTLMLSLMLVSTMMALSLVIVSWGREHDSLKKWSGAVALEAIAYLLVAVRGHIPDFISLEFPTVLLVAAQSVKLAAIHEYREQAWPRWRCLAPIGLAVLMSLLFPLHDFHARLIWSSMIFAAQMLMILDVLRGDNESRTGRAWWLLFGAIAAILSLLLLRGVAAIFDFSRFATVGSGLGPSPVQMLMFVGLIAMSMLGSLGFILMVKERADRKILALAMIDSLTGVFNRRAFMERAEREYAIAQRNQASLALLMIDIDFFKRINDEYGHPTGDDVLVDVARILTTRLRKQDTLGRYGGEEFCVLLPNTDEAGAMVVAETLRQAVAAEKLAVARQGVSVTISIGVTACPSSCPERNVGFSKLLDDADAALYQAKSEGRNRTVKLPIGCLTPAMA